MREKDHRFPIFRVSLLLISVLLALATAGCRRASTEVALSGARFHGLTRIVADSNPTLTGLGAAQIIVTRPDGAVVPESGITGVEVSNGALSVTLAADTFARITSEGATIATRAFKRFRESPAVAVERRGEPAANGYIIGTSRGLDEGWNTIRTDLNYVDPVTGEKGLYSNTDVTPDRDDKGNPVDWNNGRITVPAHKSKTMLMLLVEFSDRRAADAEPPYQDMAPYMEFLQGAREWFARSSYGQFDFSLASPQIENKLGWIMMDRKATEYRAGGSTVPMHAYIAEACQKAYDLFGLKVDDFDLLVIMPPQGKAGLSNGPAYIHHKPTGSKEPNVNRVVYVDHDKKPHYIDTAITVGNDLFRWGYRWAIHESGHTFGLPDLYSYLPFINEVRIGAFFFCGGWDMMGNISGHSTDFLAWHKWKLRWIRDDQVDVVSQAGQNPSTHFITPVETPGGSKLVVVRTGLATAYAAEFRTKLGVNALDDRGKYSGVLLYRIDATKSGAYGSGYTGQIISKKYYHDPLVGGPLNLTGLWRPIESGLDGYDSPDCCWQPGDVFSDPATGVTIRIDGISRWNAADPSASPYTADDVAEITVEKTMSAELAKPVVLSDARLENLTRLTFATNIELAQRVSDEERRRSSFIREDSWLTPGRVVITRTDGSVVTADQILKIDVAPERVSIILAAGAFTGAEQAAGATVATKPYFHFGPGEPTPIGLRD